MGFEGIVSKRVGGIYWSGRCRNWIEGEEPRFSEKMSCREQVLSAWHGKAQLSVTASASP